MHDNIVKKADPVLMWPAPPTIESNVSEQKQSKSANSAFTCCVPVCFSNSKWNHEESICNFP